MTEKDDFDDRRQDARQRIVRAAITHVDGPLSPIPCVMLDISAGGARLHAHEPSEIPDAFHLQIESDSAKYKCQVVWRSGNEVGLRFVT